MGSGVLFRGHSRQCEPGNGSVLGKGLPTPFLAPVGPQPYRPAAGGRRRTLAGLEAGAAGPWRKDMTMLWRGFQRPKRLEFERETLTDRFGRFYAQPFERGFGTTVGNAMRRVLLSSIEGAAVTAVKIEGVLHEFSPIQGVVEDATDIILNLKQIPLKVYTDQPKTLVLRASKPGEVRARDIVADADVDVLEPDAH